jgi:hypothetical protein
MRRVLLGLTVAVLLTGSLAAPARADPPHMFRINFHGAFAIAAWQIPLESGAAYPYVQAVWQTDQGLALYVDENTYYIDANGDIVYVETYTPDWPTTSGFSFQIDQGLLSSATVSAVGLPVRTCRYVNWYLDGCTDTTIDVHVDWTGQGPMDRWAGAYHYFGDGMIFIDHQSGRMFQQASAAGTLGSEALTAADNYYAAMADQTVGQVIICRGAPCF